MKTAPKNGTRILVHDGEDCYIVAWITVFCRSKGWAVPESEGDEQGGYHEVEPLEWMPIPRFKRRVEK